MLLLYVKYSYISTMTTRFDIRLPEKELEILEAYCQQESRTKTDVVRELIRSLNRKLVGQPDQ
jgi:predicted DNA-binding protein